MPSLSPVTTIEELLALPEDGQRHELLDGVHVVTPSPFLRKLSKARLRSLREADPRTRLSDAHRVVANEYGFPSWRALKAEVDRRCAPAAAAFLAACKAGDVESLRSLLAAEPGLVQHRSDAGDTGLHLAVRHPAAVRLLLEHGADPNARDRGDNALPLHFAAGGGHLETVRALLDGGSDVHGHGDLHQLEAIGWSVVFGPAHREVAALLVERGARHHVFSAIALGDLELLARVVEEDPEAIGRRLSRFEQGQSAVHYVVAPPDGLVGGSFRTGEHYRTLELLVELGADLDALDDRGRTPLDLAMLRADRRAIGILRAAGASESNPATAETPAGAPAATPPRKPARTMLSVTSMAETIAWYRAVGFEVAGTHGADSALDWAALRFGAAELMIVPGEPARGVSLWIETDDLDGLYQSLKARSLARTRALVAGEAATEPEIRFSGDLHTAFYGQREFGLIDPNGVDVYFCQPG